ncbi:NB-ARC domain-containing protein [Amycolatopsis sp. EV170708-02-1]|nr:BTAD domain-containing putative transcriptional regulator [Amycolatopsis sp. EV170708-02-1]UMP07487.1 NB-ARC domain-containing protein [Amycolatopsis sp. EV170708-02-1]
MLASRVGQVVARDDIIDGLWADPLPGNPSASIYTYINSLRRALDPQRDLRSSAGMLESVPPGYRLNADEVTVDAARFTEHLNVGSGLTKVDPEAAIVEFEAALGLWHDSPLADVSGPFVQATRLRLFEQRFSLVEDYAAAMLTLGRHESVIDDLRELVRRYPLREHPRSLLMQALHRAGRTDEALAVFSDLETLLSTKLGIDPGAQLHQLRDRIASGAADLLSGTPVHADPVAPKPPVTRKTPAQLPRQIATFVGRDTELGSLRAVMAPAIGAPKVGVLTGPAGAGKTTLAVKIAHELAAQFPDGQLFLNLRGFDPHEPAVNPAQALVDLLGDLGAQTLAPGQGEAELSAHFRSTLSGKRMLVVLDNAQSSEQVRPLLPGDSCLVLVTSRNRLDGLVVRDGAHVVDLDPLRPHESTAFLVELLGEESIGDAAALDDLGRIAELCGHLPLALSMVARRLVTQPATRLSDVVTELSDESDRLNALSADGDAVRPAFSWSYQALKPEAAQLFRRLGLHPGDEFSTGAAAALAGYTMAKTRKLLGTLANGHLIAWAGRDRYRIHDLLHLYTKELVHSDEIPQQHDSATRRLLDWYLYTTENACRWVDPAREPTRIPLAPPPDECQPLEFTDKAAARNWIFSETASLRLVLRHAAEQGYDDYLWKIVCLMWDEQKKGTQIDEWTGLLQLAVAAAERQGNTEAQMWATIELAYNYLYSGRFDRSLECFTRCREYWSTDGAGKPNARLQLALALTGCAHIMHYVREEPPRALEYCLDALPMMREEDYALGQIWALGVAGMIYRSLGRVDDSEAALQESFKICKEQQPRPWSLESYVLRDLAWVEQRRGRQEEAKIYLTQALTTARRIGNVLGELRMLVPLRQVLDDLGQVAEAKIYQKEIEELMEKYSLSEALVKAVTSD